jgi:hypothetical protein
MKYFALILISILTLQAQAYVKTTFFVMNAMIQILPKNPSDPNGTPDLDSVNIYREMNVPVKQTVIGPGKSIATAKQDFSFACAIRQGNSYECSIMLAHSPNVVIDSVYKRASFKVKGDLALELRDQFYQKDHEYHFISSDKVLKIDATEDEFSFEYNVNGVTQ